VSLRFSFNTDLASSECIITYIYVYSNTLMMSTATSSTKQASTDNWGICNPNRLIMLLNCLSLYLLLKSCKLLPPIYHTYLHWPTCHPLALPWHLINTTHFGDQSACCHLSNASPLVVCMILITMLFNTHVFTTYSAFIADVKSMLNENLGGILDGTQC
jgi:hypothetical protein